MTAILLRTVWRPLKAITLVLLLLISMLYWVAVLSKLTTALCKLSSEFANTTWSSANSMVLNWPSLKG